MKFKWFNYILIPKLIVDITILLYLSPAVSYLCKIAKYLDFTALGVLGFILSTVICAGFIKYGKSIQDKKFQLLISISILIMLSKTILIFTTQYRFFYFLLTSDIINYLLLFITFWFSKDVDCKETYKLAIYFRNSAIIGFIMLMGNRLMVLSYSPGKFIYSIGTLIQIIIIILIFSQTWHLFNRLSK
jgi:hypothetical protein